MNEDDGDAQAAPDGETGDSGHAERAMVGPDGAGSDGASTRSRRGRRREKSDPLRTVLRGFGQLLITAGMIVLLFVVYELWITNILGEQQQAAATAALDELWQEDVSVVVDPPDVVDGPDSTVVATAPAPVLDPDERERSYDTTDGVGFAKLYIPTFGSDFMFTIVEGTRQVDLYAGPGHYHNTQYPGQPGNFAMAGHRVNKGAPFDDVNLLESCDALVIETRDFWYIYRVLPMQDEAANWDPAAKPHCDGVEPSGRYSTVYGQEITYPSDAAQIRPVPHVNDMTVPADAEALMTFTTCHPKFSDRQRMIIHSVLVESYPKTAGFLPPEMQES